MELVLEFLSKNGKTQKIERLTPGTFTLGRAYSNDIIINDPYTSPEHAEITITDDEIWISNKSTLNGIRDTKNQTLGDRVCLEPGQRFLIGNQALRITDDDKPLQPTLKMTSLEYNSNRIDRWYWATLALLILYGFLISKKYFFIYTEILWPKVLTSSLSLALMPVGASIILALIKSLLQKDVKFFTTIVWLAGIASLSIVLEFLMNIVLFNVGDGAIYTFVKYLKQVLTFGAMIWLSIYLASFFSYRKITALTAALTACFLAYNIMDDFVGDRVFTYPRYQVAVLPPGLLFSDSKPHSEWVEETESLFKTARDEAIQLNSEAK